MPIYALGDVEPEIDPEAFVHPDAIVIGRVQIGPEATIWPTAVLRGDDGLIVVGPRTSVQDGAVVHCTAELATRIGAECVIGHLAHLEGCTIHDGALVGSSSVVLHAAEVHTGALVGAGALVPNGMIVPPGAMALGVPAKIREASVDADVLITPGMRTYVARGHTYRKAMRRLSRSRRSTC